MRLLVAILAVLTAPTAIATPKASTELSAIEAGIDAPNIRLRSAKLKPEIDAKRIDMQLCQARRRSAPQTYTISAEFLDAADAVVDRYTSEVRISPRSPQLPPPCAFVGVKTRPDVVGARLIVGRP